MFLKRFTSALLFLAFPLSSHSAVISGYVYNIDDGIYVESARVRVAGTDISALTGRGGRFRITGLVAGEYTLFASSTGIPATSTYVTIENDYDEVTVNFNMSQESVFELDEFVVEGSLMGAARGMDIRRTARDYREVVSSDAAGQFTDRNPAEALQRVAGVTVEDNQGEGKFLIIRGSSPDLNAVQIDGVSLPTPEADGRSVNLNVITVDQLERIELSKTWLPSQKGNVIGGTVNLITRSALDRGERFGAIEFAGTYRAIQEDELSYRTSVTYGDYIGSNRFESLGDKAFGIQFSVNQSKDYTGSDTVNWGWTTGKAFEFNGMPRGYSLQSQTMSNYNIDRDRKGGSARLEFRLNDQHEFYVSASINEFDDIEREHTFRLGQINTGHGYVGRKALNLTIVNELGLDPNDPDIAYRLSQSPNSSVRALTFEEVSLLGDVAYDPESKLFTRSGLWATNSERQFIHTLRQDTIESYQIGGKHLFPWDIDAKWKVYQTEASQESNGNRIRFNIGGAGTQTTSVLDLGREIPYLQESETAFVIYNAPSYRVTEPGDPNNINTNRWTTYLESNDMRSGGDLDLEKQFNVGSMVWTSQVGYSIDKREKEIAIDNNSYGIRRDVSLDRDFWPLGRLQLSDPFFDGGEIDRIAGNFGEQLRFGPSFNEENTLALLLNPEDNGIHYQQNLNHFNNNITSKLTTDYLADENINAFYLQQNIDWGKWSFIFGFRYEKTENTFTNLEILTYNPEYPQIRIIQPGQWRLFETNFASDVFRREVTTERSYDHLLPALHVIREIGDNMRVRGSVTKTMARPIFTDLIPREVVDVSGPSYTQNATLPAFDLMPMESINYDISLDYYLEPVGLFSMAVFYKDLDGPIYNETRTVGPNEETLPWELRYNSRNANLAPGAAPFNDNSWRFSRKRNAGKAHLLGVEVTYDRRLNFLRGWMNGFGINSNISFMDSEAALQTTGREGEKVPLFRQPDMTANFSLYYEKHGLFARLSYNLRGKYLQSVTSLDSDLIQLGEPTNAMDLYLDTTARLDFTMRYNVWRGLQVFFEALNLTNEPQFRYRGSELRAHSKQFTDQVFTLGVKWNL